MAKHPLPTPADIAQLLRYDPETGQIFHLPRTTDMFGTEATAPKRRKAMCANWNKRWVGFATLKEPHPAGYSFGTIRGWAVTAHRVAWVLYYGKWPTHQIDHINGIRNDNRISNLRDVTQSENMRNRRMNAGQASGAMGVAWVEKGKRWQVVCNHKYVGRFKDFDAAVAARKAAEIALGFHPNHGRA